MFHILHIADRFFLQSLTLVLSMYADIEVYAGAAYSPGAQRLAHVQRAQQSPPSAPAHPQFALDPSLMVSNWEREFLDWS